MLKTILPQIYPTAKASLIIANGLFPKDNFLIELIRFSNMIICCDGAIDNLIPIGIEPNYIIGDCDSIDLINKKKYGDRLIVIDDQDTNDLTKAINLAHKKNLYDIIILGATGLREDHTIANIALLSTYIKLIKNISIITDHGIFTAYDKSAYIKVIKGQQISFFTNNTNTRLTCRQLKWPLINFKLDRWFSGSLNQSTTNYLDLECNSEVIVYRSFEIRSL